ncbi:MAG: 2-amino-4-hydroxy-6-hydroxymethyldihydropteridine diphosphokinase [Methylobacter tundripaludum]|jgi:2-amino-4-hydroxy-6-hydroxymethyldihydropteridine diphosphokinase|uniref:2-amino-4-hydroxy-6-hydroxymethyldihydropteridine pyrophosphokinase n=1 Tax=Methylobacter tundripaludum TaxID=173365 RepID=A0A2S6H7Z7_9GAMM|nr:2-amino-4-hydroxy-6-hydroxymethyldihydropteridine diphosphokinase [Methylobacter tundripaludum]MCK9637735.1 2-amino-4-hydroxy-6-hydroxymethyldihydropteridine diphosphokinase [Methylobacter tundripaludum]PPK73597.1 2-amino-4-hydroxy-6-hydroxymethyldihydropteridine diphosphokinase [Methylobacter tundripaludum]
MKNPETDSVAVYIGLGSNLANPAEQIKSARTAITQIDGVKELAFSSLYHSAPMGPQDQPDYVNAVMCIETRLPPIELLRCLQHIENDQGRVRKAERWGARTLDLDMLIYGDRTIELPDLTVPHVGIAERAFVLYPLYEIAPQLRVPGKGDIADLLAKCPLNGLKRLD